MVCFLVKMTTLDLQINSIFISRPYTSIHSTRLISVFKRMCDASKATTLAFVVNYQKKLGHKLYESKINATFHGTQIPFFVTVCKLFCILKITIFNAFLIVAQCIYYYLLG